VILALSGLAASLNSLPFPGIGIFIFTSGLSWGLWRMTIILKSSPKSLYFDREYFKYPIFIFFTGIVIAKIGEILV